MGIDVLTLIERLGGWLVMVALFVAAHRANTQKLKEIETMLGNGDKSKFITRTEWTLGREASHQERQEIYRRLDVCERLLREGK